MFCFEGVERWFVAQGQANVVEPFDQAELAEGIDLECRVKSCASVTVWASSETVS